MHSDLSTTDLLEGLKEGDEDAAQALWERYFAQLIRIARRKLGGSPRRAFDASDVVVSAFASFWRGVQNQKFPRLRDRHDLWQVLLVLTERKSVDHLRRARAAKRGGGKVRGESAIAEGREPVAPVPTPAFAAEVAEEFRLLLGRLGDETLRQIAIAKLEGYENQEIAKHLGLSRRSVQRKLNLIRQTWSVEAADAS